MQTNVDGEVLRNVMRRVPTPVTVVTAQSGGEARGITIGSFVSVSLDPPLITFNVHRKARMHAIITEADRYVVHILREEQAYLSERFARADLSGKEQFASVAFTPATEDGLPILNNVLAVLFCRPYAVYEAGDHSILVGKVEAVDLGVPGRPVLYYNRAYYAVGKAVVPVMEAEERS
ncbi:flavin reductase family protein [Rhodocaloribacter sp.]